jgi:hypothetical protein
MPDLPHGLGIHDTLRPACELPTSGGHDSWRLPAHAPGGVQPPIESYSSRPTPLRAATRSCMMTCCGCTVASTSRHSRSTAPAPSCSTPTMSWLVPRAMSSTSRQSWRRGTGSLRQVILRLRSSRTSCTTCRSYYLRASSQRSQRRTLRRFSACQGWRTTRLSIILRLSRILHVPHSLSSVIAFGLIALVS